MVVSTIFGFLVIFLAVVVVQVGCATTESTVVRGSDGSWYVVPAIVWSSVAALIFLGFVILSICFFLRRRMIIRRHKRFYSRYEIESRRKNSKHSKRSRNGSNRTKSTKVSAKVDRVRASRTGSGLSSQRPKSKRNGSHRSETDSEIFNVSKANPVYVFDAEEQRLPTHVMADRVHSALSDIYETNESLYVSDPQLASDPPLVSGPPLVTGPPLVSEPPRAPSRGTSHHSSIQEARASISGLHYVTSIPITDPTNSQAPNPHEIVEVRRSTSSDRDKRKEAVEGDVGCYEERPLCCFEKLN